MTQTQVLRVYLSLSISGTPSYGCYRTTQRHPTGACHKSVTVRSNL